MNNNSLCISGNKQASEKKKIRTIRKSKLLNGKNRFLKVKSHKNWKIFITYIEVYNFSNVMLAKIKKLDNTKYRHCK